MTIFTPEVLAAWQKEVDDYRSTPHPRDSAHKTINALVAQKAELLAEVKELQELAETGTELLTSAYTQCSAIAEVAGSIKLDEICVLIKTGKAVDDMDPGLNLYRCLTDTKQYTCAIFDGERHNQYPEISKTALEALESTKK